MHKIYQLYLINKDIEENIQLHEQGKSTTVNDSVTENKIYTYNWIADNF